MYRCKHFVIQEIVPPEIHAKYGETAWSFFNERILCSFDAVREKFGPCVINDWHRGGKRKYSGMRTPACPDYSPGSQHTFCNAGDLLTQSTPVTVARQYILDHPGEFPFITGVELGVPWLHIDCRNAAGIITFSK